MKHSVEAERAALLARVEQLAAHWQPRMGVAASSWTIRAMRTRWGSCTIRSRRIRIALAMARLPEELLEYVVVHELAHLIVPGHGAAFRVVMDRFLPDWRARRQLLRGPAV